jgi:small neutral amino acid transporter SnatA (MarC family)
MGTTTIDTARVIETFLLLLIGIGPKIALVPYLEATAGMEPSTKQRVLRKMLTTATVVALALFLFGELLARLLHFSTGSLSVAGGVILFIIAATMVLGRPDPDAGAAALAGKDPMSLAVYPLAVPYLLNPAGIVALVTLSAEAGSIAVGALDLGVLAVVLVIDFATFWWGNRVSDSLNENTMLVTEKVFGFLLAALGVQLVLNGLFDVGAITLTSPH